MPSSPPPCSSGLPAAFLSSLSSLRGRLILVTGGSGFLGGHIVQGLLAASCRVRIFDVAKPRDGHGLWKEGEVDVVVGDLLDASSVASALRGVYCVIHVASPSPTSRNPVLFQRVNVDGTRLLIEQCKAAGVDRFVYTSSASVVFDGRDQRNFDEKCPPPMHALDDYTKSKLAAEQVVLSSNSSTFFATSIRPHSIFGPRDPHFLPVMAETGRKGKSKFMIGDGSNLVDFTYVENVAFAHLLAAAKLGPESKINGEAFFITNREPIYFWEMVSRLQRAWGYPQPFISMPVTLMKPFAKMAEAVGNIFGFRPTFTTQAINYSGCAHYYSSAKAVELLGYQPPIDLDEAIRRSLASYWHLRNKELDNVRDAQAIPRLTTKQQLQIGVASLWSMELVRVIFGLLLGLLLIFMGFNKFGLVLTVLFVVYGGLLFKTTFLEPVTMAETLLKNPAHKGADAETPKKVILVTGSNRGLGFHTCMELMRLNVASELILACRSESKAKDAMEALRKSYPTSQTKLSCIRLDLASFESIRQAGAELASRKTRLDILVHNAGGMFGASRTPDGFDVQFQGNFLGHVYFTNCLLAKDVLAPAARIVNVSSMMHRLATTTNLKSMDVCTPSFHPLFMYCRTKLFQLLWAEALQRRFNSEANEARLKTFAHVTPSPLMNRRTIVCVNPGAVATDFIDHFLPAPLVALVTPLLNAIIQRTPIQGVQSILYAALSHELDNVGSTSWGAYIDNCCITRPSALARSIELQEAVYSQAQQWCNKTK